MSFGNREYLHSYCSSSIYYFINFFSLLSLLVSVFLIFSLSYLYFFFPSLSLLIHLCFNGSNQPLLFSFTPCWSSSSASTSAWMGLINLGFLLEWVWVSAWSGFRLRSTMRMRNKIITKLGFERSGLRLDGGQWRLQEFCLGGSLKNFNKKNLNISNYQQKKKF